MISKYTIFAYCLILMQLIGSCTTEDEMLLAPPLEAAFEADIRQVKIGDTVSFRDMSIGLPSQWKWVFEGGSPSSAIVHSPIVIYDTVGLYPVTLEVRRGDKVASISVPEFIEVGYRDLNADFTTDTTVVKAGEKIRFTDNSEGLPVSWAWEFYAAEGPVITANEQYPEVGFTEPGYYTVKLTVSHPGGTHTIVKENYLTVLNANPPQADFSASSTGVVAGSGITFESTSTGEISGFNWTFEGGTPATSTEASPTVVYQTPGRYTVTLETYDQISTDTKTSEGYVLVVPADGLVAYYPMDGSGADAGPSAIDPSTVGNVVFSGPDRRGAATAAQFDGSSLLLVADHPAFNFGTGDFTVSLWVNTSNTRRMTVWNESGANGGRDNQAWLRLGDNTTDRKMRFCVEDGTGGTILNIRDGVSDGEWHHVVCVREGRVSRVYIDGALVREGTASAAKDVSSSQPFKIGAQETGGGGSYTNYFNGLLDDFLIYGRAFSAQEVSELFELE
ncbi:LamG-like jellyroll fold domain-containing protein [Parapedobacter sp. 10938]|uniref:LamG-like jellyroll fold domain-containing protein n=1 Tax=Parapedobacter flavus TaxID=3110225 RepID=UPI002DB56D9A|nr:LamG-like jellyroll fold domain-containing protein [Parapedobacter sp. 10938]MEC3878975.1 LamG-like jellyroll fold domain-containing protein [Parapedobacter sp. 10938]